MAPFRPNRDEYEHDLPWRLMQNGPVTLYWRREYFAEDIGALRERGFVVPLFDCRAWPDEFALHEELRVGLGMPDYTGHSFDALNDSLSEIDVPEESGVMVALDNVTDAPRADVLLDVWRARHGGGFCLDASSACSRAPTTLITRLPVLGACAQPGTGGSGSMRIERGSRRPRLGLTPVAEPGVATPRSDAA